MTPWKNLQLIDDNDDDKQFFLDSVGTKEREEKQNTKNFLTDQLGKHSSNNLANLQSQKLPETTFEENE